MLRNAVFALMATFLVACGIQSNAASVVVDGRTYVASAVSEYSFESSDLTPYRTAERVDVPGSSGNLTLEIAGVDPLEALILPAVPGGETAHWLLIRQEVLFSRKGEPDLGIGGLCHFRLIADAACP